MDSLESKNIQVLNQTGQPIEQPEKPEGDQEKKHPGCQKARTGKCCGQHRKEQQK